MVATTDAQQGDMALLQTDDNGDIEVVGGILAMSAGLDVSIYLALFGGNEQDDGSDGNPLQWWGNLDETMPARRYRSRTQHLLRSLPATGRNIKRLEDAIRADTQYLLSEKIASEVTVRVTIPAINRANIQIDVDALGEESTFTFTENWKASV